MQKTFSSGRACALLASIPALALTLAGCGGSGGSGSGNGGNNTSLPSTTVTALTANNRLAVFNAQRPGNVQQVAVTGLRSGEQLIGIDLRISNNTLYGLGALNGSYQLYRLTASGDNTAAAVAVQTPFTISPALGTVGFDFNPAADRIRLVDALTQRNFRLNPDTGAIAATDPNVAYATTDTNTGKTPLLTGAAYTNNDTNAATPTVNYAIDVAQGTLVSQGDNVNGATVSPNTGQLFTIGALSTRPANNDLGFDITPTNLGANSNRGLVAFPSTLGGRPRLYEINLTNGQLTGGAFINVPATTGVLDIAVTDLASVIPAKAKS